MTDRRGGQQGAVPPLLLAASEVAVSVAMAVATGCGSSVEVQGGGGTAGSGTGAGTTTPTSTGTTTTSTSLGPACEDFLPPPDLGGAVEIRLVNATSADLFLGEEVYPGCGGFQPFELHGASGDPPPIYDGALDECEFTCSELQDSSCGCAGGCMMPYVIRLIPGGAHVTTWAGYVYERPAMPSECFLDPLCGPLCALETTAPASLRVRSLAYREVSCVPGPCTCAPDGDGSCLIYDGTPVVAGAALPGEALWQQGAPAAIVTFGP